MDSLKKFAKLFDRKTTRRQFLKLSGAGVLGLFFSEPLFAMMRPDETITNPFEYYPSRDWERVYRDLYSHDSIFTFLCAPNDTHNCLLRAYVKNGTIARIGPTYGYQKATDVYGNKASARWDPRCCQKGLALVRRFYGPRRVKQPMIRKGFKAWVEAGFPRESSGLPPKKFFDRGKDGWLAISWGEAERIAASALANIAANYSGKTGGERLTAQGYDASMIEAMHNQGTQAMKFRGGMPFLGAIRVFGMYRFANSLALLDAHVRKVGPDEAHGARGWDNYSWHTDLPPGHTMVTGHQTVEFDLAHTENAKLIIPWGMNWITTKMPDGHWLSEARIKGARIVTITCEYSATASKSDDVIVLRPGTDGAFSLGLAHVILKEKLYDEPFVKSFTDLPLLVRMDTSQTLKASEVFPGYKNAKLTNFVRILKEGEKPLPPWAQEAITIPEKLRDEWGDFVVWDAVRGVPAPVSRDEVGTYFIQKGVDPSLEGSFRVKLVDGKEIEVRPAFDLVREYIFGSFDPAKVSELTWAPKESIENLAREIARNPEKTLFAVGMGPNHFFNNDLKDRTIFLVAALTRNVGFLGGNVGSYAGNYRGSYFNGQPQYAMENPFDIEPDSSKPSRVKKYYEMESAHYFNYGDRPLRVGNKLFTGKTHTPTPTKSMWFANSNSILGNIKWHYDTVVNTLPKIEAIFVNEWWWTASCEYADLVFAVDSWSEFKSPDMAGSVTNPFVQIFPRTPLDRIFNTRGDVEVYAGVAKALADLTGDKRFVDYWKFVSEGRAEAYLQRILDASTTTRGYKIDELEALAKEGVPALMMTRIYPKTMGWEQSVESKPWYTKTGRLEFYRPEPEFIEHGENIPIYREPIDGTKHEPNVIVAVDHPLIHPTPPESYGLKREDLSVETRQVRNVIMTSGEVVKSEHPRIKDGFGHVYITPKYRHGAHTTPVDTDMVAVWFGPFGDLNRRDKRMPWVSEGYVDLNPTDAKVLGVEDGDYVWIDADPEDRPYRGWKAGTEDYKVARCLLRARYYPGMPRGIARSWFNMYGATHGSVEGHEKNADGLARNPRTGYQSMHRYGSHQSATRAWLKPTLMTDTLVRKGYFGQLLGKGFEPDVHCPVGAPKEAFVKITKAENGGMKGIGLWEPAAWGLRPGYESEAMKNFIAGGYIKGASR